MRCLKPRPISGKDASALSLRYRHRRAPLKPASPSSSTLASESSSPSPPSTTTSTSSSSASTSEKSDAYSTEMSAKMGAVLTYRHEDGINWSSPLLLRKRQRNGKHGTVLVGSCPQNPKDVARLSREAGVTHILQLQQGADLSYFGIDGDAVRAAAASNGIEHLRIPIVDFDPASLRERLPDAVAVLDKALRSSPLDHESGRERDPVVYVHCTAGLGRAPAVALAHACWCRDFGDDGDGERGEESNTPSLEDLYQDLRSVRPCAPKVDAIKEAAADLVLGGGGGGKNAAPVTIGFRRGALELCPPPTSSSSASSSSPPRARVAGLDAGWGARLEPKIEPSTGRATLTRKLCPGKHYWKMCWEWVDEGGQKQSVWATSPHHPTYVDASGNENNVIEVPRESGPPTVGGILAERRLLPPTTATDAAKPWRLSRQDKKVLRAALAAREARAMNEAEDPREAGLLTWLVRDIKALLSSRRR